MDSFCTYSIEDFKKLDKAAWLETMKAAAVKYEEEFPGRETSESQIGAWDDEFDVLQRVLQDFNDGYVVFEYILYSENGCRPDVLLVSGSQVFVLEFKRKNEVLNDDVAQADMYGRFISTCHVESRGKEIITCLVLTRSKAEDEILDGSLHIVSEKALRKLLDERMSRFPDPVDIDTWQKSKYEPDKNSLELMVDMFENGNLPHLKTARSTKIPIALKFIKELTTRAQANNEHWLVVVSGVPGAGKTLLGVQYIYESQRNFKSAKPTYVSGNGPLLKVLQGQLKYPSFMMGAPSFVRAYQQKRIDSPNILVFDEAQRMWSQEQMKKKNRGVLSENRQIIGIMEHSRWAVLVALVGEGQEIYSGEDGGIKAWATALPSTWKVAYPPRYESDFAETLSKSKTVEENLYLDACIRSQGAEDVSEFVNTLLENHIEAAKALYKKIKAKHFRFYLTHDFGKAKKFCTDLYADRSDKRYGCLTSSQNPKVGRVDIARWFNDPKDSSDSCCQMRASVSEFDVEGLELDMPIVGWYDDLKWDGTIWVPFRRAYRNAPLNRCIPHTAEYRYRINTYRVLLTRGRDGLVICIPDRPELKAVYDVLKEVGLDEL